MSTQIAGQRVANRFFTEPRRDYCIKEITMKKVEEVAEMLGVTIRTIYNWIKGGRIKASHIGKRWYISQDEVDYIIKNGLR